MKRARKYCREDGLTLVEIVLILVVTAIAVIPLSRLSITNIKTNAQQHVNAAFRVIIITGPCIMLKS